MKERLALPGPTLHRLCIARALAVDLKYRVTIVIVTHNLRQAARVADRTAFMLDATPVEVGPTSQVFTNPGDERTEEQVSGKFG